MSKFMHEDNWGEVFEGETVKPSDLTPEELDKAITEHNSHAKYGISFFRHSGGEVAIFRQGALSEVDDNGYLMRECPHCGRVAVLDYWGLCDPCSIEFHEIWERNPPGMGDKSDTGTAG